MLRLISVALLACGLFALPLSAPCANAQTAPGTPKADRAPRQPTPGQLAARARQKKCAAEWKAQKAAGKIESGMTWPKYWSACNKRLKAGG